MYNCVESVAGYQNNGRALPVTLGQTNGGWLLLEYQKKNLNNIEHDRQSRKRKFLS